jgi:hypothetical protein
LKLIYSTNIYQNPKLKYTSIHFLITFAVRKLYFEWLVITIRMEHSVTFLFKRLPIEAFWDRLDQLVSILFEWALITVAILFLLPNFSLSLSHEWSFSPSLLRFKAFPPSLLRFKARFYVDFAIAFECGIIVWWHM